MYKEEIYKQATSYKSNSKEDTADGLAMLGVGGIAGGGSIIKKTLDRGNLTGRETLYHSTEKGNVDSILRNGLQSSRASDPNNLTNKALRHIDKSEIADKVYFGKNKAVTDSVARARRHYLGVDSKTLKANVPSWKFKETANPELLGAKNVKEFIEKRDKLGGAFRAIQNPVIKRNEDQVLYKVLGPKGTLTLQGNVGAEYFKDSKNYKKNSIKEISEFIKKNPKRFAKGVGGALAGAGLISGGALLLGKARQERKNSQQKTAYEAIKEEIYK